MKRSIHRTLSVLMALVMSLTLLPAPALADAPPEEPQVLYLPMNEAARQEQADSDGPSLLGVAPEEASVYYLHRSAAVSDIFRSIPLVDEAGQPVYEEPAAPYTAELVDSRDKVAVTRTEDVTLVPNSHYEDGQQIVDYQLHRVRLAHPELAPGDYRLRLRTGSGTLTALQTLRCLPEEALLLQSAHSQLTLGEPEADLQLTLCGFRTEAELDALTLTLIDKTGAELGHTTGDWKELSVQQGCWWYLTARLAVDLTQPMKTDDPLWGKLTYTGPRTLYSNETNSIAWPQNPTACIRNTRFLGEESAQLEVQLERLTPGDRYQLRLLSWDRNGVPSEHAYWAGSFPGRTSGTVTLQLTHLGRILPMSALPQRFQLYLETFQRLDREDVSNPWYGAPGLESADFSPRLIAPTATGVRFRCDFRNGTSLQRDEGNLVTVLSPTGAQVGQSTELFFEERGRERIMLEGSLTLTGPLTVGDVCPVLLNGARIGTLTVTEEQHQLLRSGYVDNGLLFTAFGRSELGCELLNVPGPVRLALVNTATQQPLYLSDAKEPWSRDQSGWTHCWFPLTPEQLAQLDPKATYQPAVEAAGKLLPLSQQALTYDPARKQELEGWMLDLLFWDYVLGDTALGVRFRQLPAYCVEADMERLPQRLVFKHENGQEVHVTGCSHQYDPQREEDTLTLSLSGPLSEGGWTVLLDGRELDQRGWVEAPSGAAVPSVYQLQLSTGTIMGQQLPVKQTYTGQVFAGYEPVGQPLPLTPQPWEESDVTANRLHFRTAALPSLVPGHYTMRVSMGDQLLGDLSLDVPPESAPALLAVETESGILRSPTVHVTPVHAPAFWFVRLAETPAALAAAPYTPCFPGERLTYAFSGEDGPRTLYAELSPDGQPGGETTVLRREFYLATGTLALTLPADQEGPLTPDEDGGYTLTAQAPTALLPLWATLTDKNGRSVTLPMTCAGPAAQGEGVAFQLRLGLRENDDLNGLSCRDVVRYTVYGTAEPNSRGPRITESLTREVQFSPASTPKKFQYFLDGKPVEGNHINLYYDREPREFVITAQPLDAQGKPCPAGAIRWETTDPDNLKAEGPSLRVCLQPEDVSDQVSARVILENSTDHDPNHQLWDWVYLRWTRSWRSDPVPNVTAELLGGDTVLTWEESLYELDHFQLTWQQDGVEKTARVDPQPSDTRYRFTVPGLTAPTNFHFQTYWTDNTTNWTWVGTMEHLQGVAELSTPTSASGASIKPQLGVPITAKFWTEPDPATRQPLPAETTFYQWCRGSQWTPIPGATGLTYTPTRRDVGEDLGVFAYSTVASGSIGISTEHFFPFAPGDLTLSGEAGMGQVVFHWDLPLHGVYLKDGGVELLQDGQPIFRTDDVFSSRYVLPVADSKPHTYQLRARYSYTDYTSGAQTREGTAVSQEVTLAAQETVPPAAGQLTPPRLTQSGELRVSAQAVNGYDGPLQLAAAFYQGDRMLDVQLVRGTGTVEALLPLVPGADRVVTFLLDGGSSPLCGKETLSLPG